MNDKSICQFFLRGNCRFGNRCKNLHQRRENPQQPTPSFSSGPLTLTPASSPWPPQPQPQPQPFGVPFGVAAPFGQLPPAGAPFGQGAPGFGVPQAASGASPFGQTASKGGQATGGFGQMGKAEEVTVEEFRDAVKRGLWPLGAFASSGQGAEGMSIEELRIGGGQEAVEAMVERRSQLLGISLEALKKGRPGEARCNRFYPNFIPREPLVVVTDDILAVM